MANFKTVTVKPMTGNFDSLSSPDEIGFGGWRVVKNAVTRSTRNRQRAGGWRRLFAEDTIFNNQDLHDQLTDRLAYYDSYSADASFGGGLVGYTYAYQAAPYTTGGDLFFSAAEHLYSPVYLGDYTPTEIYNGCRIFYPFVVIPYVYLSNPDGFGHPENTTGYPDFYQFSYFYTSCEEQNPELDHPGYRGLPR